MKLSLVTKARLKLDEDIDKIKKSKDPDSKFVMSYGHRETFPLGVTLKSIRQKMIKRALNEDLSDMELKRTIFTRDNKRHFTYKYVKKQKMD